MAQQIRELMTPHPVALPGTASVHEAARAMRDAEIGDVIGFMSTFGDSRKRNTLCSTWTPRRRDRAPAASDRLPPCTTSARTARPSRMPRHSYGTRGVRLKPHLWRCA